MNPVPECVLLGPARVPRASPRGAEGPHLQLLALHLLAGQGQLTVAHTQVVPQTHHQLVQLHRLRQRTTRWRHRAVAFATRWRHRVHRERHSAGAAVVCGSTWSNGKNFLQIVKCTLQLLSTKIPFCMYLILTPNCDFHKILCSWH